MSAASDRGELLSTGEVASALGVTINTVKRWAREGEIEAIVLPSGHHRIPRAELERLRHIPPRAVQRAAFEERQRSWQRAEAWRLAQPVEGGRLEDLFAWVSATLAVADRGAPLAEPSVEDLAERVRVMRRALAGVCG